MYSRLDDPQRIASLWEQLLYIVDNTQVNNDVVFEFPVEDDSLKVVYGPPFTIVFKNLLGGNLAVYSILNPAF